MSEQGVSDEASPAFLAGLASMMRRASLSLATVGTFVFVVFRVLVASRGEPNVARAIVETAGPAAVVLGVMIGSFGTLVALVSIAIGIYLATSYAGEVVHDAFKLETPYFFSDDSLAIFWMFLTGTSILVAPLGLAFIGILVVVVLDRARRRKTPPKEELSKRLARELLAANSEAEEAPLARRLAPELHRLFRRSLFFGVPSVLVVGAFFLLLNGMWLPQRK